jgi:hypothetical protein
MPNKFYLDRALEITGRGSVSAKVLKGHCASLIGGLENWIKTPPAT